MVPGAVGKFNVAAGINTVVCATCGAGKYQNGTEQTGCKPCAWGKYLAAWTTEDSNDDASDCTATLCLVNQHVSSNACLPCAAGTTNDAGGDDASGPDTECAATIEDTAAASTDGLMTGILIVAGLAIGMVCGRLVAFGKKDIKDDHVDSKEVALEMAPSSV